VRSLTQFLPCVLPATPPAPQTMDPPPPILHPRWSQRWQLSQELLKSEQMLSNTTGDFPYHKISCLRSQWANTPYATWTEWSKHIHTSLFLLKSVAFQQPRTSSPSWDPTLGVLQRMIQAIIALTQDASEAHPILSLDKLDYILSVIHRPMGSNSQVFAAPLIPHGSTYSANTSRK
jgi:hypothetical protein